ncbi:MAG: hypothetical protein DCC75_13355 [Proteobacteria bacterium]|nr:MAG: hypothetical protein DCC75_13355 [Pseudomonadota bacterium]
MFKDNIVFIKEFLREFQATGTAFPTSKWAAKALTSPINQRKERPHLKILELGPGTGAVTLRILERMHPGDELTLCEINPRFMEVIKEKIQESPLALPHLANINYHCCPVQELPENDKFDVIICAIPFLNLERSTVEEIFAKLKNISSSETIMTYYEYIGLRSVGKVVSPPKRKKRIRELDLFFRGLFSTHLSFKTRIWLNLLPINIYVLKRIDNMKIAA